ncbi:hypothetical protein CXY01_19520 [Cellulomonas xylanilytica]|uniref:Uncharacterized protein n=1 Tax=Cellulomonas xylanilytica TaxID=233583 RepID=A0A510V3H2_9CELL|nr:hypothetical protein CXY01_19520 [Cellulomonas xylanilytica]
MRTYRAACPSREQVCAGDCKTPDLGSVGIAAQEAWWLVLYRGSEGLHDTEGRTPVSSPKDTDLLGKPGEGKRRTAPALT